MEMSSDTNRDYLVWDDEKTRKLDMYLEAGNELARGSGAPVPIRTQKDSDFDLFTIYDCSGEHGSECDNVFTPENLKIIKKHT